MLPMFQELGLDLRGYAIILRDIDAQIKEGLGRIADWVATLS